MMILSRYKSWGLPVIFGILANASYYVLTYLVKKWQPDIKIALIIMLVSIMVVLLLMLFDRKRVLKHLGFINIYQQAHETTQQSLQDVKSSYWWLGTSAYYVLCSPQTTESYIESKKRVEFVFMTIDPNCKTIVSEQANWERIDEKEMVRRIEDTLKTIERLKNKDVKIKWESYSISPSFRIIIVDGNKILVSFYEPGKLGPQCEQLELDANSLLGSWFIHFFNKTRASAKRMRTERDLLSILIENVPISKPVLVDKLRRLNPDLDDKNVLQMIDDLLEIRAQYSKSNGTFQENCTFCRIANENPDESHAYDKAIIETSNLIVIPALGHFIDGYLLICSRKHLYNFGEADSDTFQDFVRIKKFVAQLLNEVYHKRPVFFEHGPSPDRKHAGSCLIHAHMHAVPVEIDAPPSYISENLKGFSIGHIEELRKQADLKNPYFYFECSDGSMYIYEEPILECQYGRKVIAQQQGIKNDFWDWRRHPFYDKAAATWEKLNKEVQKRESKC